MVIARTVNAAARNFYPPHFCVFFRDLGRILRFKIPVKYNANCNINHKAGQKALSALLARSVLLIFSNRLELLTIP